LIEYVQLECIYGFGFCLNCKSGYEAEDRPVPCIADNICRYTNQQPLELSFDNRLAWELYLQAISLSGYDEQGLPLLTNLPLVLKLRRLDLDQQEGEEMLQRLIIIHNIVCNYRLERIQLEQQE